MASLASCVITKDGGVGVTRGNAEEGKGSKAARRSRRCFIDSVRGRRTREPRKKTRKEEERGTAGA